MKRLAKVSLLLAAMALFAAGCSCHNKLERGAKKVTATASPEVLVLKDGMITTNVTVNFPAKFVGRNSVVRVTPVLEFEDGEIVGTPKFVQGERVKNNYTVVSFRNGGSYTQTVEFPYDPAADISTLKLYVCGQCPCDIEDFEPLTAIVVAHGVSNPARWIDWTEFLTLMEAAAPAPVNTADLLFLINRSEVRPAALNAADVQALEAFIKEASANGTLLGVSSKGYASPEGPLDLNNRLSRERGVNAATALARDLRASGVNVEVDVKPYGGEDWDGLFALLESSNIPDGATLARVLRDTPMRDRENQLRGMMAWTNIKDTVLPKLRRAELAAQSSATGATSTDAASTANNNGVALAKAGQYAQAIQQFKAAAQTSNDPAINNNLGVVSMLNGNVADAQRYFAANQGISALLKGDFATAGRNLNGYNRAVALVGNNDLAGAKTALGNLDTANADYLRAVINMREGNPTAALSNLNSAFSKDSSLRAKAKSDAEFFSIRNNF